jgi:hypothetical protein
MLSWLLWWLCSIFSAQRLRSSEGGVGTGVVLIVTIFYLQLHWILEHVFVMDAVMVKLKHLHTLSKELG